MSPSDSTTQQKSSGATDPPETAQPQAFERRSPEPMDPQLTSIQPGGGIVMRLELAWGYLRRGYLKTFRRGYVERMAQLRQGDFNPAPHEVLDPRDLKFYRNQGGWHWKPEHDPFRWRDRIGFARAGLAELFVLGGLPSLVAVMLTGLGGYAALPAWAGISCLVAALGFALLSLLVVWFFRDPPRAIPPGTGLVVSPADGKVVSVREIDHDDFIGGPVVEISIFLSIFNVHINRVPVAARVIGLQYKRGKFLNAMRPEAARENEQVAVRIEHNQAPFRRMIVRQITGAVARRIVCWLKPGDELQAGERFGMIKLGSRTELVLPREDGLQLSVQVGDKVEAGSSVIARYREFSTP